MFPDSNSRSAQLNERASLVLAGGSSRSTIRTKPYTLYLKEAVGAEVVDVDGNRIVDFINNYTSLIHGHAYPPIVEAVKKQLADGSAFSFCHESEIQLAELLCDRVDAFERILIAMASGRDEEHGLHRLSSDVERACVRLFQCRIRPVRAAGPHQVLEVGPRVG